MQTGTVKFYNTKKGWGFITPTDGSKDIFVHVSSVEKSNLNSLIDGQKVSFELAPDREGRMCAADLKVITA